MAAEAQKGLSAAGLEVLGVVGFIRDQHGAGGWQALGQARPAEQLQLQLQRRRLLLPVAMQPGRGHHNDAAVGRTHHGPGGHQSRERLTQPHGIRQDGTTARQQPTGRGALMGKQHTPVRQRLLEIGKLHKPAMRRQRRQGLLKPGQPLLQGRVHGKAASELTAQHHRGFEWELPAGAPCQPLAPRPHSPELRLGDGIEGQLHLNGARRPQSDQATGRRLRGDRQWTMRRCGAMAPVHGRAAMIILMNRQLNARTSIRPRNCIARHIDIPATAGKLSVTEPSGCTPGMRFSSKICAPNFAFDAGDKISTHLHTKPAFTAENPLNPSIMCSRRAVAG